MEHDSEVEKGKDLLFEGDHFSCPHFIIEMSSVEQVDNFLMKTPSLMKHLNLAHYVVILKKVSVSYRKSREINVSMN